MTTTREHGGLPAADAVVVRDLLRAHGDAGWLAITERYGRVFRFQGGVVTSVPEEFQSLLMNRAHTRRRAATHRFADRFVPGAAGILFKDGDAWRQRLRPYMAGFQAQAVADGASRLRAVVDAHIASWHGAHAGPDLFAAVTALGLEVALVTGYNLDPRDPVVREFGETLVAYKASTMRDDPRRRLDEFSLDWRKTLDLHRVAAAFHEFREHTKRLDRCVTEIVRRGPWADPSRQGWVQALSDAGLRGRALTDELNHVYGAFTAADYTTACALAELAHAPAWVARLRDDPRGDVAEAVLHETTRRYPVAMVIYRELGEPMALGGETFPAGTMVMALPYALHHDPAWWERPQAFDPSRWMAPLAPRAATAFEPFLKGPRRCLGEDFARQ